MKNKIQLKINDIERWGGNTKRTQRHWYVRVDLALLNDPDFYSLTKGAKILLLYIVNVSLRISDEEILKSKGFFNYDLSQAKDILSCSLDEAKGFLNELATNNIISLTRNLRKRNNKEINKEINKEANNENSSSVELASDEAQDNDSNGTPSLKEKCEDIADVWNVLAADHKLPQVRIPLSADRIKAMKPALKEFPKLEDWGKIICEIEYNKFCLGENDRNWKANFDWLFHKTKYNYRKLWESYVSSNRNR